MECPSKANEILNGTAVWFVCLLALLYAMLVLKAASNNYNLKASLHSSCCFLDLYR